MTLSPSLITSKNWLLNSTTSFAPFAGILSILLAVIGAVTTPARTLANSPKAKPGCPAPHAATASKPNLKQLARKLIARGQFRPAISCLRRHLAATPGDVETRAQLVRVHAWAKDYGGARKALRHPAFSQSSSPLGAELAGDIAWYEGKPLDSARHYLSAVKVLQSSPGYGPGSAPAEGKTSGASAKSRDIISERVAALWPKVIRGYRAGGDHANKDAALAKALALLPKLKNAKAKQRLTASLAPYNLQSSARPKAVSATSFQASTSVEFLFRDRFAHDGYSRTLVGRGGMRGRNTAAIGLVALGQNPNPTWRLGLIGERRERFFSALVEPTDTIFGGIIGYDFGQPRHALTAELRWTKNPAFTYHNQFSLAYNMPVPVGSVDFSLRHTRYETSRSERLGLGLSYYTGPWLLLPKIYANHIAATNRDGDDVSSWRGAVDVKGVGYFGRTTIAAWVGGGQGESSQPVAANPDEQVGYIAYGASVARSFANWQAGLSAARQSEPRYHQNTLGFNLSWRRF